MRISGIIHQQICQLKWHLLACLGLIMVLPIEEAVVNLKEGYGFFCTAMAFPAIMIGPLLAGLIACANVQSDLNDKRYIFWRSKPANVKWLITLKFFIGLAISLFVIACLVVFTFLSNIIWNEEGIEREFFKYYVPLSILIAIMTYSLCFASNVVVRKTARAWLIGMLIGCFLLVLPFMLPMNYKDIMSDVMLLTSGFYLVMIIVTSATAFVFALFAAQHDWHLRTNFKWLLCAVAGLVFILLILFSSQVANIKVLQEKEVKFYGLLGSRPWPKIEKFGGKLIFANRNYIDIEKNNIHLSDISGEPDYKIANIAPNMEGYYVRRYPIDGMLYKNVGNDVYSFHIHAYCRSERQGTSRQIFCDKVYLRSYTHKEKNRMPGGELDLSDCVTDRIDIFLRVAMRLIDNRLIACINNSCIVVDVTDPGELKLIDKKLDVLKKIRPYAYKDRKEEFSIPLIPIEEIRMEERIRLSIDLNYGFYDIRNKIYESSIVDIHDGKFAFFIVDYDAVAHFDVTHWDDEKVYCRFKSARPFTILEVIIASHHYNYDNFVKNGQLYSLQNDTFMIFDIRSKRGIRKLGHFVRMDYRIEDIEVLEDGNILLCVRWDPEDFGIDRLKKEDRNYLYLLKNPE